MKKDIVSMFKDIKLKHETLPLNPDYTYKEGQEKEFANFVSEYVKKIFTKDRYDYVINDDVSILLSMFLNSMSNFKYDKLWECIDKRYYCDDTRKIYDTILKRIDWPIFKDEINKSNDFRLVYDYYMLYGNIRNIPLDEMVDLYLIYLKNNYLARGGLLEKVFCYFFESVTVSPEIPCYRGRGEAESIAFGQFDVATNELEVKSSGKEWPFFCTLVELPVPMRTLVIKLLPKINLDFELMVNNRKEKLRDYLPCKLIDANNDGANLLLKQFLSLNPGTSFETWLGNTNIIQLNAHLGNYDEIKTIVNNNQLPLYDQKQYDVLKEDGMFYIREYGYPLNYISWDLPSKGLVHQDLLDVLMNDKVKMIPADLIKICHDSVYLTKEEYNELLKYIKDNGVLLYYVDYEYGGCKTYRIDDINKYIVERDKYQDNIVAELKKVHY